MTANTQTLLRNTDLRRLLIQSFRKPVTSEGKILLDVVGRSACFDNSRDRLILEFNRALALQEYFVPVLHRDCKNFFQKFF